MEKVIIQQNTHEIPHANGFTLIELLMTIGVLGLLTGIIITVFVTISSAFDRADVMVSVNHEGTRVMELVSRMIRNSIGAELDGSDLVLTIPNSSSNIEYNLNGGCASVRLRLNADALEKITSSCAATGLCSTSPCVLTTSEVVVEDLLFVVNSQPGSPDMVEVSFDLQQKKSLSDPEQQSSLNFSRVVSTRNY